MTRGDSITSEPALIRACRTRRQPCRCAQPETLRSGERFALSHCFVTGRLVDRRENNKTYGRPLVSGLYYGRSNLILHAFWLNGPVVAQKCGFGLSARRSILTACGTVKHVLPPDYTTFILLGGIRVS